MTFDRREASKPLRPFGTLLRSMNFRSRSASQHPGIQLAPLVDVLLLLLIFFLMTWNAARNEMELDVKVPKASAAKEKSAPIGDVIVNVKADGNVVVNRRALSGPDLTTMLKGLVQLNADQAVVIRGDEAGAYKNIVNVLNICSEAGVTNVAFATAK
jgi:biopolymer transport protein ExbD